MLWSVDRQYGVWPFEHTSELHAAVAEARADLFGDARPYVDVAPGEPAAAAPGGFVIDLSSPSVPLLYVVQIDLASRAPLRRIAQQLLDQYLTARTMPKRLLASLRQAVRGSPAASSQCDGYAAANGYAGIDQLLETLVDADRFRAIVVVDALDEDLERGLRSALRFPIEILTFRRFRSLSGRDFLYDFEPFLHDLAQPLVSAADVSATAVDPADVDTLVVPARDEAFKEMFLGDQMWGPVRIPESMLQKIRYVAAYQVAPVSAITHVAEVDRVEAAPNSTKYTLYFKGPPQKIGPIEAAAPGDATAPVSNRYTSFGRLCRAHTIEEAF